MGRKNEYVIGIDTGGTYTDAVLLDYHSRKIVAYSKTLTTRENLTRGITKALENLHIKKTGSIRLVGVSSTLATNSIAEGKERQTGLILIGYDRELITAYHLSAKFPTTIWANFSGGHTTQGLEKEPLDVEGIRQWVRINSHLVDALAISAYFSPLNPDHEERALEAVRQTCALPVVLGHHLSTKLDSIKRATTACLNASLVAVMQAFIEAVCKSLKNRGIHAPLMIVKGDGSLISAVEAIDKPVETVLSGPAASAIGGRFLSGQGNALVIDVGGTTTDMALVDNFTVTITEDGARVGRFETAVKAARIRTTGLGGDSRIAIDTDSRVRVGPERVVPLSRLAAEFPDVKDEIAGLMYKRELDRRPSDLEYWFLYREDNTPPVSDNARLQELIGLLKDGPLNLTLILQKLNIYHPLQLNAGDLIRRGAIEQAALTPTDLLHVTGRMDMWDATAARQALAYAGELFALNPDTFAEETLDLIVARMFQEAIIFLGRQTIKEKLPGNIDEAWGRWLVDEAASQKNPYLAVTLASRFPIIGIGAPAGLFVRRLARLLHADFILSEHAPVANAVGAVAGSIIVEEEAIVYAREHKGTVVYVAQIGEDNADFAKDGEAVVYAEQATKKLVRERALAAGAINPRVTVKKSSEGHLQRIVARGIGNPKL
jgi:N-methylhydantoinase A/oxoprolinase/acetone carboxylase beta subunit